MLLFGLQQVNYVDGKAYDFTLFAALHPGGKISVAVGEDMTSRFHARHGQKIQHLEILRCLSLLFSNTWSLSAHCSLVSSYRQVNQEEEVAKLAKRQSEVKIEPKYGTEGGVWREWVGRHSWFLFHSIAAKYPEHPSQEVKTTHNSTPSFVY